MEEFAHCEERFAGLDKKMGRGLTATAKGHSILLAQIELEDRKCQEKNFRPLTGRQILCLIYEHFRTIDGLDASCTMYDITHHSWIGDKDEQVDQLVKL